MKTNKSAEDSGPTQSETLSLLLIPLLVMSCLFWKCFFSDYIIFLNDGPCGLQKAACLRLRESFLTQWFDLNTLGFNAGTSLSDISSLMRLLLGPLGYVKFLTPISLWLLGAAGYFCFRRSDMAVMASILDGLAACFTTGYFTNACWGAASQIIEFGMNSGTNSSKAGSIGNSLKIRRKANTVSA